MSKLAHAGASSTTPAGFASAKRAVDRVGEASASSHRHDVAERLAQQRPRLADRDDRLRARLQRLAQQPQDRRP